MAFTTKCLLVILFVALCSTYDIKLDDENDTRLWIFKGQYNYIPSLTDGGTIAPLFERKSEPITTNGVWHFKHSDHPDSFSDNVGEIRFRLTHHLMAEVIVRLLADPAVVVKLQGLEGKLFGMFSSTGKEWCDATYDVWKELGSEIRVSANLTEPGTYLLVDRITIGAMSHVKSIDRGMLRPCKVVKSTPVTTTVSTNS